MGGLDTHLGAFQDPLGSTVELPGWFGWFGCHLLDSCHWVAFVENVAPCEMYGKLTSVCFSRVGGCLEGPGWSLCMVLDAYMCTG